MEARMQARSIVAMLALAGCSSQYLPRSRGHVAVSIQDGKVVYVRDGGSYPHGMFGGGLVDAVAAVTVGLLALRLRLAKSIRPAFDVDLLHARKCERAARNVFGDGRSGADVRVAADRDGRDQLRVPADERAGFDRRLVLADAVVVARDRAGADVRLRADRRVAEVREVVRLRAGHQVRLLGLDEVAEPRVFVDPRAGPAVAERSDLDALAELRVREHRVRLDVDVGGDRHVGERRAGIDPHVVAERRLAA